VTFASLAATLALPSTPAGPKNRLRSVRRIDTPHGVYFLKTFTRTQWQNRLRFLLTAPRADDDAEREAAHDAGAARSGTLHASARGPSAARGAASYYLCAALPGTALRELTPPPRGSAAAARYRHVLRADAARPASGCRTSSAEHVFVDDEDDLSPCSTSTTAGSPPLDQRRTGCCGACCGASAVRCRISCCRGRWCCAARCACCAPLAAAASRALLRRCRRGPPPPATTRRARASPTPNATRPHRARTPAAALGLAGPPGESVLDLPCGAGRLLPLLRDARPPRGAGRRLAGDAAAGPRARDRRRCRRPSADALAMPFADRAVDGVVMFRFLHHLPREAALAALAEACRVASRFVVVSFFHPCSVHHAQRLLKSFGGTPRTRFTLTLGTLATAARRHGFVRRATTAQWRYVHDLWLAAFERTP
jgi:ubiquinone/menaquinone biosynthesis C-methylase UbiE